MNILRSILRNVLVTLLRATIWLILAIVVFFNGVLYVASTLRGKSHGKFV